MATQPAVSFAVDGQPDFITYERRDGVAWIMLDRPQYANAQNAGLLDQLDRAFRAATDDLEVKVGRNHDKPAHVESRRAYYEWLTKNIAIPGIGAAL